MNVLTKLLAVAIVAFACLASNVSAANTVPPAGTGPDAAAGKGGNDPQGILLQPIPEKVVVLTFDDACASQATFVAPLLKKYGFGATFYVCEFGSNFSNKTYYMSWEQMRSLDEMGFEIGNHTRTHPGLNGKSPGFCNEQLEAIESRCMRHKIAKPTTFCWPGYSLNKPFYSVLADRGYLFARGGGERAYVPTTDNPFNTPSFAVHDNFLSQAGRFANAARQATAGQVVIFTFHGVPDLEHEWVTTDPSRFEACMRYLKENNYTVIAMRDLARYIDVKKAAQEYISTIQPVDLRCEYLVNPLGIDPARPRLSWVCQSGLRGQRQTAYRVLVASSRENLARENGDLWDSGVIKSEQSIHIAYEGKPLESDRHYYWKVRVWDKAGEPSNFSPTAFWETGLLLPGDWKGKWIGDSTQQEIPAESKNTQAQPSPRFRKSFDLKKPIKEATLFISGVGYYEAWLNGKRVGDHVLDPAFTRYDKGVLYVAHDVTDPLINGDNAIGVQLGNGWYNMHGLAVWEFNKAPWRDSPRMIMQLNVTYNDGSSESIVTDKTWKMSTGPFLFDSIRNGEIYDARLETPGWDKKDFDDNKWESADEVAGPKGVLRSQMMPPIRVTQTLQARSLSEPQPGVYVFDLGQNFAGWVKLKVQGPRGTEVTLRHSHGLDAKGMVDLADVAWLVKGDHLQKDIYILKGEGVEERQTHFSYYGFQYVEVSGLPGKPSLDDIEGMVVQTDFETIGQFECSNKLINTIHNLALWSYRGNYHGYPTDCPHREKNGWTGDAHLATEMGLFNFHQGASYSKWLNDFKDEQQEDGTLPGIIPTGGWGYKWGNGPAWDSAYILIPWYLYLYNGDTRILEAHYDGMKKYVDRMGKWATKDKYIVDYGLGDWAPAKAKTPRTLTSTGYYYVDALTISKVAGILGKSQDQKKYANLADAIRAAFNKHFYKGRRSGTYDEGTQAANSCALYQGLAEADEVQYIVEKLVADIQQKDEHLDVGILGAKYLFNALTENGQHELAYRMVTKTTKPSYGYWVDQGATTMWEHWPGGQSLNHIMFGDIDAWFYKHLAGISYDPEKPGFKNIIVYPRPAGDLTWARAHYQSPYGLIKTSWKINDEKFYLDVTVPVNSTATVYVPADRVEDVREGGKTIGHTSGVKFVKMENNRVVLDVDSGHYEFVTNTYQRN